MQTTIKKSFTKSPIKLGVFIVWLFFCIWIILSGFKPDPYLEHVRDIPPPHPYPLKMTLWLLFIMFIQAAFIYIIDKKITRHAIKLFTLFLVHLPIVSIVALMSMHATGPYVIFTFWQIFFLLFLIITAIITILKQLHHFLKQEGPI